MGTVIHDNDLDLFLHIPQVDVLADVAVAHG
jgi:hypothetical protein